MNETKFWIDGTVWGGIQVTANDTGTTKYWLEGVMYGDVFTPSASSFVPIIMWFM
jgi:hypothetical protein